jgi:hypothetical protein
MENYPTSYEKLVRDLSGLVLLTTRPAGWIPAYNVPE